MRILFGGASVALLILLLLGADAPTTVPATAPSINEPLTLDLGGGISMEFVLIKPGSFIRSRGTAGQHRVTLTKPYYLGKSEVTQEQWQALMGNNPSTFKGARHPVENIGWDESMAFLKKLSIKFPDRGFALPTEAQWEYASRAGSVIERAKMGDYAWISDNSAGATHPVGQKKPNAWGLYDMYGNVAELCSDWFDASYTLAGNVSDPVGPENGTGRIWRGGEWSTNIPQVRVIHAINARNSTTGLRVVCLYLRVTD